MANIKLPENEEERRAWIERQKAKGVQVYKGRTGWVTRAAPLRKRRKTQGKKVLSTAGRSCLNLHADTVRFDNLTGPGFATIQAPAQLRAGEPAPQKEGA